MGVAAQMDSSNLSVANSQQMLTGGGNPGGNNDGTSHVHTGDSGDRNSIEADMSGDNGSNLSSTTATTNASSMMGPPAAAARATIVLLPPLSPPQLHPLNNRRHGDHPAAVSNQNMISYQTQFLLSMLVAPSTKSWQ
jgi:hypothetical protein